MKKSFNPKFKNPIVKNVFWEADKEVRVKLLFLRELIFKTSKELKEVGEIEESLKWGEPSYVPIKPKVGSPIRINKIKNSNQYAMFFNCNSNLVPTYKQIYPKTFNYGGNRSIIFNLKDEIPVKELSHCISLALTYHINKKSLNPTLKK